MAFTLAQERACGADKGCIRPKGTKQQLEFHRRVAMALLDTGWGARTQCRRAPLGAHQVRRDGLFINDGTKDNAR